MSILTMSTTEQRIIDSQVEGMLDWASTRKNEAEQLAMDATRLLSCTSDRLDKLARQGFFKRCCARFTGETSAAERANTSDLIHMQKISLRYINMLQEQQLMLAHSMLTVKNNLLALTVKEEETRNLITTLAQRTLERFEKLESRVEQLEISSNLQGWLLSLEERDYNEKYPTEFMRLFKVINDFYSIKNDNWNYNDLMFMRKAIRTVQIDPKKNISLKNFIGRIVDEIQNPEIGIVNYERMIEHVKPDFIDDYSAFAIRNISSPVFTTMHKINSSYEDRYDIVGILRGQFKKDVTPELALKITLLRTIMQQNVNLDYEFSLAETAIEILGCMRLAEQLAKPQVEMPSVMEEGIQINSEHTTFVTNVDLKHEENQEIEDEEVEEDDFVDVNNLTISEWYVSKLPKENTRSEIKTKQIVFAEGCFWLFQIENGVLYIYKTEDLGNWDKVMHIAIYNFESHFSITFLGYVHGHLIVAIDRFLYISTDMKTFRLIILREKSNELTSCVGILYEDGLWCVSTVFFSTYVYTEEGFLWDKQKEALDIEYVLFTGNDLSKLKEYKFKQQSKAYGIFMPPQPLYYDDGFFYALLCNVFKVEENGSDHAVLTFSQDGKKWDFIDFGATSITALTILNGETFVYGDRIGLYRINSQESGINFEKFENIDQDIDIIYPFNDYGIAFYQVYTDENIFITNDFYSSCKIDLPFKIDSEGSFSQPFYYGGGVLILWNDNGGEIVFCELY